MWPVLLIDIEGVKGKAFSKCVFVFLLLLGSAKAKGAPPPFLLTGPLLHRPHKREALNWVS